MKQEALAGNEDRLSSTAVQSPESNSTACWEQFLTEGTREVFEMMVGVPLGAFRDTPPMPHGEFTAVIGVGGAIHAIFSIRCDQITACGIASGMLGVDSDAARGEVWDALGELCNMIIGNFKNKLGKLGENSIISVPTVIHGHDYKVRSLLNGNRIECVTQTPDGVLCLRLDYRLA